MAVLHSLCIYPAMHAVIIYCTARQMSSCQQMHAMHQYCWQNPSRRGKHVHACTGHTEVIKLI